jgi:RND family efflux transporter MFP subunit
MKQVKIKKLIGFLALAGLIIVMVVTLMNNKKVAADKIYNYDKSDTLNVVTQTLQESTTIRKKDFSGIFRPNKEVRLSAEAKGEIIKVMVENGEFVKKGEALLEIDHSLLTLNVKSIDTKLKGIENDIKRYRSLVESSSIQGIKLEKALLARDAAEIEKATINEQIDKSIVRAPFNGVVTGKLTEEGAFAAPGVPLFQLSDISRLKFTILTSENSVSRFHINDQVKLTVDAFPDTTFSGKITMIGSKANKANRFPVEIQINNAAQQIKAGMYGNAIVQDALTEEKNLMIPLSAVIGETSAPKVYVVRKGKAMLQAIELGRIQENQVAVIAGLNIGDVLVVEGITKLFDGANVATN